MNKVHPDVDSQLIERIVREVASRLRNANAPLAQNGNSNETENQAGTLSLGEKVISVATLTGKLDNVSHLRLQPKAVLTPAARDELRDKGVEITFEHAAVTSPGQPDLIFATTNETTDPQLLDRLARIGIKTQLKQDKNVKRLVANLVGRCSATARAIVFADQPYIANSVANRHPSIRAAVVRDEAELKIAKKELNPNVIVVPIDRASILDAVAKELVS